MMRKIIHVVLLVILVLMSASAQSPVNVRPREVDPVAVQVLDDIVDLDGSIWQMTVDQFMKKYARLGFRWNSADSRDVARSYGRPLSYMGFPVMESIVSFSEGKVSEVTLSIYNRGDAGEMPKEAFSRVVGDVQEKISKWIGVRPRTVESQLQSGGVNKDGRVWSGDKHQVKVEWSYSTGGNKAGYTFRPEYIRLQFQSAGSSLNYASSMQAKKAMQGGISRSGLKAKVKTESSGDIFIDGIPMVDQGQKGYCVVATMERVMRYYGRQVDQHEMAQMAQTKTEGGTSMEQMIDALRRLGMALGCKVVIHENWDWKSFQRFISEYNRAAKGTGDSIISIPTSGTIMVNELYDQLKVNAWREARMKKKSDYGKFTATIASYVKQGIPLPWTVYTGVLPEEPPIQGRGGHMRMIIGYNTKTTEIIYTDSWGPGHEKKRMSMADAWTMTDGLYTVEPRMMTY